MAKSAMLFGVAVVGAAALAFAGSASAAQTSGGCTLDANMPTAMQQQIIAALNASAGVIPAATYQALGDQAAQVGFPLAAACLRKKAQEVAAAEPKTATSGGLPLTFRPGPAIAAAAQRQAAAQAQAALFTQAARSGLANALLRQQAQTALTNPAQCQYEDMSSTPLGAQVSAALNGPIGSVTPQMVAAIQQAGYPQAAFCLNLKMQVDNVVLRLLALINKYFYDGDTPNIGQKAVFQCDPGPLPPFIAIPVKQVIGFDFTPTDNDLMLKHSTGYSDIASTLSSSGFTQAAACVQAKNAANQANNTFLWAKQGK